MTTKTKKMFLPLISGIAILLMLIIKYFMPENNVFVNAVDKFKTTVTGLFAGTEKIIFDTLIKEKMSVKLALLVLAQTKHETANYTSNVFKKLNNVIGYKVYDSVYQTKIGTKSPEGNNYGSYATVVDGAKEAAGWYRRRNKENGNKYDAVTDTSQYCWLLWKDHFFTQGNFKTPADAVKNYQKGIDKFYKINIL